MLFLIFLLTIYPFYSHSFELCSQHENIYCGQKNPLDTKICEIKVNNSSDICEALDYTGSERLKPNIGEVLLYLKSEPGFTKLFFVFNLATGWKKALIKNSYYNNPKSCETLSVDRNEYLMDNLDYGCRVHDEIDPKDDFLLEVYSENENQFTYKKILFNLPNPFEFRHFSLTSSRHIFSYIDFTNSGKIILKIQPLEIMFMVMHYKIEVFREKENHAVLLDVRLIYAKNIETILNFEYFTYSEEGYYYFAISEISQYCPEDMCYKTFTPKVHITRKGRPLIIGIVGASLLIPLFLFSFYWWNYKYRNQGLMLSDPIQKVLVLFKPSFEKHNEVVTALIDSIETLSKPPVLVDRINLTKVKEKTVQKFCSDNLILATHIVYINPPFTDDEMGGLDYMTFNFLKEETKKVTTDRKLIVVRLPYCKIDSPPILSKASYYELVKDFQNFLKNFSIQTRRDYSKSNVYMDLIKKIEIARLEAETLINVPEIVVTDEAEESLEVDGLIG